VFAFGEFCTDEHDIFDEDEWADWFYQLFGKLKLSSTVLKSTKMLAIFGESPLELIFVGRWARRALQPPF